MNTREFSLLWMMVVAPQVFSGYEKTVEEFLYRNETVSFFLKRGKYAACGTSVIQQMMKETPVQHAPYFDRTEVTLGEILTGDKSRKVRPPVWSIHIRPYRTISRSKSAKRGQRVRIEPFYREPDEDMDHLRESRSFHNKQFPLMSVEEKRKRIDFPEEIARRDGLPTHPPTQRRIASVEKVFNDPYLSDAEKMALAEIAVKRPSGTLWTDSHSQEKKHVSRKDWVKEVF